MNNYSPFMIFTMNENKDLFLESNEHLKNSDISNKNMKYIKLFFCWENIEYLKNLINKYL